MASADILCSGDDDHAPITLQILGCGSPDALPSVQIVRAQHRLLFGCGEGTQRLCNELRLKASRFTHIMLSQLRWTQTGGLPGMLLTLADTGAVPAVTLVGPPGLAQLFHAARAFFWRPDLTLHMVEAGMDTPPLVHCGLQIAPYVLLADGVPSSACPAQAVLSSQAAVFGEGIGSDGPVDASDGQAAEAGSAGSSGGAVDCVVLYVVRAPDERGKFHPDRARALGVPKGPAFGALQRGEAVTLADGRTVQPDEVMAAAQPGALVAIVHCPTKAYVAALASHAAVGATSGVHLMVHATPAALVSSPCYLAWLVSLGPDVRHVVANEQGAARRCVFQSAARQALALSLLSARLFPRPYVAEDDDDDDGGGVAACTAAGLTACVAEPLLCYPLRPVASRGFVRSAVPPARLDEALVAERVAQALAAAGLGTAADVAAAGAAAGAAAAAEGDEALTLEFLGTGCAIPSKYRNVSGTLLRAGALGVVLDAGEGSLGQLYRRFGPAHADAFVASLRLIFVSHLHADHHLGLPGILARQRELGAPPPLVIAPRVVLTWLREYSRLEPLHFDAHPASDFVDAGPLPAALGALGVTGLTAVRVAHCHDSYGVCLQHASGWKAVFSGDCRPSDALVAAGAGATVCLHEATFEDDLAHEALAKNHATTAEALGVGRAMQARVTVLNHFSQRYPALPVMGVADRGRAVVAFDLMSLDVLHGAAVFGALEPAIRAVLASEAQQAGDD